MTRLTYRKCIILGVVVGLAWLVIILSGYHIMRILGWIG